MAKKKKFNFYEFILHSLGWRAESGVAPEKKCVILGVPHTCIGDFLIAYFFYKAEGGKARVMIKKEFFWGPLGWILKAWGCIPVDRSSGATVVRSVISAMEKEEGDFHLCIAPEGTRKPVKKWKMGYHAIAKAMNCPVYLGYFDWGRKRVSIGERFEISDNAREDTDLIQKKYEEMKLTAKHPEKYCTH